MRKKIILVVVTMCIAIGLSVVHRPHTERSAIGHVINPANEWLLAQNTEAVVSKLGRVAGQGCVGETAFYQGDMKTEPSHPEDKRPKAPVLAGHENDAFWDVKCHNGRSYSIEVHPDGSGTVLDCSVLEALHAGKCFKKF